jgi:hypothetical protein
MARLNRLSYREEAASIIVLRLKQLILVILTALFGVLISVSVNAQKTSEKKASKKSSTYQTYKKKNRAKANHYASISQEPKVKTNNASTTQTFAENLNGGHTDFSKNTNNISLEVTPLPAPTTINHSLIREMVALNLKENEGAGPIELAPLHFQIKGNKLSVNDVNPFLIAVEFALQGKVIVIDNHPIIGDDYNTENKLQLVDQLIVTMIEMGVPAARISVDALSASLERIQQGDIFTVSFTAI